MTTGIETLPNEVLGHIFTYLNAESLLDCTAACTAWKFALSDGYVWKKAIQRVYCPDKQALAKLAKPYQNDWKLMYTDRNRRNWAIEDFTIFRGSKRISEQREVPGQSNRYKLRAATQACDDGKVAYFYGRRGSKVYHLAKYSLRPHKRWGTPQVLIIPRFPLVQTVQTFFKDSAENCVYLILDEPNYDLSSFIWKRKMGFSAFKFYAAEILVGLKHLHDHGVSYSGYFNPSCVKIQQNGHVMLAKWNAVPRDSLGYSKRKIEYLAPEILTRKVKSFKVADYWCLGVVLFELFTTQRLFYSRNPRESFEMVVNFRIPKFDNGSMPWELVALLDELLERNVDMRLQSYNEIKKRAFFKGVNFDAIEKCTGTAPRLPPEKPSAPVTPGRFGPSLYRDTNSKYF